MTAPKTPRTAPLPLPHGYLFRRWRGRHLPIESNVPATIYLVYERDGRRHTMCLHTSDPQEAYALALEHSGRVEWSTRDAYLRAVIRLGELARQELFGRMHDHNAPGIDTLWDAYLHSRRRPQSGPATLKFYRVHVERFANWAPARVTTMAHMTAALAEQYVRELEKAVPTAATARKHLATLARVWRVLVPDAPNPWKGLSPAEDNARTRYRRLSQGELRVLATPDGTETPDMILVGYYTALRLSDVVSLRPEYYDSATDRLVLPPPRKTAGRKPQPLIIPAMPELAEMFTAAQQTRRLLLFPQSHQRHSASSGNLSKVFKRHFIKCRVTNNAAGRASYHSLRATFISMMDEAGTPGRLTDLITNHAPLSMHDRYSQPDIDHARGYMEQALPPLRTPPPKNK